MYQEIDVETIYDYLKWDQLWLTLTVFGDGTRFARGFHVVIFSESDAIQPYDMDRPTITTRSVHWPDSPTHFVVNAYYFHNYSNLKGKTITLKVINGTKEDTYVINLSEYK